jgi:methionyl-tRNA formyltransferase
MSTRCVFVTGHEFGMAALAGMLASAACQNGDLALPLLVTLDEAQEANTVGYAGNRPLPAFTGETVTTADGRLRQVADAIADVTPDFICVVGWSFLVPVEILDLPAALSGVGERHSETHGCIGMHPSLLPRGRGRAPLPWAIYLGDEFTGLSVFRLEDEADAGAIVWQEPIALHPRETATTLFAKVRDLHTEAGESLADKMGRNAVTAVDQDHSAAVIWAKRTPADSEITSDMTVVEIDRLIRAQAPPYPPAFVPVDTRRLVANGSAATSLSSTGSRGVTNTGPDFVDVDVADGTIRVFGRWGAA